MVTTDLRLNEPRYASLPNIMKAKKKPLEEKTAADYGVDVADRLKVLKVTEPPVRQAGEKVADVDALVPAPGAVHPPVGVGLRVGLRPQRRHQVLDAAGGRL